MNKLRAALLSNALVLALAAEAIFAFSENAAHAQGGYVASPLQNGAPTGPSVTGSDPAHGVYFGTNRVGISGHQEGGAGAGNTPVLSGCGTTPTLAAGSTDNAGTVTMGATATGCVITFGTAYAAPPSCTVTWQATPLASQSYTVTATAITTVQTSTSNNLLNYACQAKSGG